LRQEPRLVGIVEILERALDAVTAERKAEIGGGDLGHGVGFVEDHEVFREKHAAGFRAGRAVGPSSTGVDEGEQQGVVDDDHVGRAEAGARALIETLLTVAVFARA